MILDEFEQKILDNAKYFTIFQYRPERYKVICETLEEAKTKAILRYEETKCGVLIYAVADIPGGKDMSRMIDAYPEVSPYISAAMRKLMGKNNDNKI